MKFGEKVKAARIRAGITQKELAEKTGYKDRTAIHNIEKGGLDKSAAKIKRFIDAFEADPVDLLPDEC